LIVAIEAHEERKRLLQIVEIQILVEKVDKLGVRRRGSHRRLCVLRVRYGSDCDRGVGGGRRGLVALWHMWCELIERAQIGQVYFQTIDQLVHAIQAQIEQAQCVRVGHSLRLATLALELLVHHFALIVTQEVLLPIVVYQQHVLLVRVEYQLLEILEHFHAHKRKEFVAEEELARLH
jgi:hypothetical protein